MRQKANQYDQQSLSLRPAVFTLLVAGCVSCVATAAEPVEDNGKAIAFGREQIQRLQVGIQIKAGGPCRGIFATVPVPMEWPEQEVKVVDEDYSTSVQRTSYRHLDDGVKQLVVQIPYLDQDESAHALVTFEVRRRQILAPEQVEILNIPKQPSRDIRKYLAASPFIESRNGKIRSLARQIVKDKESAWEKVEAIYNYVRDNVEYRESELKGAVRTLQDKQGDCEGMTSLFIALCRANKIPARMVWVTDHSYPEFYLVDDEKQGHWIPCQVAGSYAFGSMPETRPILQKGDNIRIPETKARRRYAAVQLKAKAVRGASPTVTEVSQFVPIE